MKTLSISPAEVTRAIGNKLYAFNAAKQLAWAWNAQQNIIMYGKGGYGKSDAAIIFHELLHSKGLVESPKPYVLSFGQGMTEERLLGGLDMKTFQSEGEINYLLKNAFVEHEVVIFEEMWDAFPAVLLILKDILQSKCVRLGNTVHPIKTKMVIACTNRSREEVVSDNSTAALLERFVYEVEVGWSSWEEEDYLKSLKTAFGQRNGEEAVIMAAVAKIAAQSSKDEYKISPRTCGKAYHSALANEGIECLEGFYGFKDIKKVLGQMEEMRKDNAQKLMLETAFDLLRESFQNVAASNSSSELLTEILTNEYWWNQLITSNKLKIRDANTQLWANLKEKATSCFNEGFYEKLQSIIVEPAAKGVIAASLEFCKNPQGFLYAYLKQKFNSLDQFDIKVNKVLFKSYQLLLQDVI